MITTGQVLSESTETFTPILERLLEIAQEFVPYFIYIAVGVLGVSLLWKAVKYIIGYLRYKSETTGLDREGYKGERVYKRGNYKDEDIEDFFK